MKQNKKSVLAVILARGGSKGIKKKNIKKIQNHPLISYSIYAGIKSKYIDKLIVSTDSSEIKNVSFKYSGNQKLILAVNGCRMIITENIINCFLHLITLFQL